ncbi:hypothetical protein SE17_12610 [Kouleothrix aurantiaca]|uniref:Uncharacterized protein n=1 Tax=Kouleothrix aurantiaca TaxID=186479 RepID=A0A0P9DB12_9CHLR|nr:hypothetical protein SE17_12610 [Kouleothrix aurantiaca]
MPIHANDQGWVLETRSTAYALGLNPAGLLTHRYWGPRLPLPEDYPPPWITTTGAITTSIITCKCW